MREAVRAAAVAHPEWSFVLIGDTWGASLGQLPLLGNVHLLGEMAYDELPSYLAGIDVCTIPFLLTPLTRSTNRLKLYEYLSAGKPVVAASVPEVLQFMPLVRTYSMPAEFVSQLEAAVAGDADGEIEKRREIGRANSWHRRYQDILSALRALPRRDGGRDLVVDG